MTVTIKEITDKFYEVIDRYEGKRDYWELDENIINSEITSFFNEIDFHSKEPDDELFKIVKAYKIKKEFLVIFRSELEQVTVSYLEESEDLDDFVTAFAAFCTCVIRYDLVEKDDWTYYDALMSVVKSMSETSLPEYCDAYSEIIKWLKIICNLIGNCEFRNQVFIEQLVELCNKGCPSFFALWFFCFYSQGLCAEELSEYLELISSSDDDLQKEINDMKPYRSDFFIEIKELYKAMNNDLKEYVLGTDKYLINDDTPLDKISDRHLLPFLYIGSLTGNLENELITDYKQICNLFFYPNGRSLSIGNIIAYLNEENNSEEEKNELCWRINLLFYYLNSNNFSKYTINSKQTIKHENKGKNNTMTDVIDLFIRRKLMPTQRTVPIFIPCVIPTPDFFKELLDKNIALDNALESKERLIRDFSHRFKNHYPQLKGKSKKHKKEIKSRTKYHLTK